VTEGLPPLNLNAAGIDVGNAEHYVAVPPGRAPQAVQKFGSFTADLHRMGRWLKACKVDKVVMQATGVYWIGLYQVLEEYGLEVRVVNATYTKTLPGRKSDVQECQWLQKLYTFGLLNPSFLPGPEIRRLRTYLRQRENLVAAAGTCIQHLQKTLTEMNVQLANVLSDLSGWTGMTILRAIVGGERDPQRLAELKDERVKASREEIACSLEGNWREELLFVLQQTLELYDIYLGKIADCDQEVEAHLRTMTAKVDVEAQPIPEPRRVKRPRRQKHQPCYDLRGELYRVTGVDLTQIDGIDVQTAQTVISEVGVDMSPWKTEKHFASWLGLSPDHRIQRGKGAQARHTQGGQPSVHRLTAVGFQSAAQRQCPGGQFPSSARPAGSSQSHHGPGAQTSVPDLPHAQIRKGISGPRRRLLRSAIPTATPEVA